jgi:hypothetical protein
MRAAPWLPALALLAAAATLPAQAGGPPPYLKFDGAIGADTLTAAGGVDVLNVVRGINPGGRAWVLRKLKATVSASGAIEVRGAGLLLASGEGIATRGAVAAAAVTLFCGPADATARRFTSPAAPLDTFGNFKIKGMLSEDGINAAVLPPTCDNPQLLIRSANATTGVPGAWFAAGTLAETDDD